MLIVAVVMMTEEVGAVKVVKEVFVASDAKTAAGAALVAEGAASDSFPPQFLLRHLAEMWDEVVVAGIDPVGRLDGD